MVRLSQEVNASSINPSSAVQWGEFSHSHTKLPGRKRHEEENLSSAEMMIVEEVIWEEPSEEELSFVPFIPTSLCQSH